MILERLRFNEVEIITQVDTLVNGPRCLIQVRADAKLCSNQIVIWFAGLIIGRARLSYLTYCLRYWLATRVQDHRDLSALLRLLHLWRVRVLYLLHFFTVLILW